MQLSSGKILGVLVTVITAIAGVARIVTIPDPFLFKLFVGLLVLVSLVALVLILWSEFPRLSALPRRPTETLEHEIGSADEIWMSMHSGSVKLAHGDLAISARRMRVVLTHPDDVALKMIEKIGGGATATKMAIDIRELTTELCKKGKEVRWFRGPIGNSLLLVDPEKQSAWARIEVLIPFGPAAERPGIRATQGKSPDVFNRFKLSFKMLWDASESPES